MMKYVFIFLCAITAVCTAPPYSYAAHADTSKVHRVLILLNGSANMNNAWQGDTRYNAASDFITGLAGKMYDRNVTVEIGLAVYGAQYNLSQNRCNDYRREAPFERDNRTRLELRLADIKPKGKGSFNYAMAQVLKEFTDTAKYQYSIIVVSDSSTQCGSDHCAWQAGIPLYKTYFAGIGSVPMYNCYDRVFQLTDNDAIAQTIHKILPDFPQLVQEGEYWGRSKAIVKSTPAIAATVPTEPEDAYAAATLPRPTTAEVSIVRGNQLYTIILFKRENGVFKKMEELFFYGEKVKKMKLPFGNYKAAYYIDTKEVAQEFVVTEGSTVDVLLD